MISIQIDQDMIIKISQEQFGDGTLKCTLGDERCRIAQSEEVTINWFYNNDAELFTLVALHDHIAEYFPETRQILFMPYIPHARQDRFVSGRLFTLKSFAKVINSLSFARVVVVDPHSDVSTALLDRVRIQNLDIVGTIIRCQNIHEPFGIMFPDAGAAKKYKVAPVYEPNIIVGNKHRNSDGRIDKYDLLNFVPGIKTVIIRDDICSYGGTFAAAAKALREQGVEHIYLAVSHCENNILKGEVLDYVDAVYTTDSIFTETHNKIHLLTTYRN